MEPMAGIGKGLRVAWGWVWSYWFADHDAGERGGGARERDTCVRTGPRTFMTHGTRIYVRTGVRAPWHAVGRVFSP